MRRFSVWLAVLSPLWMFAGAQSVYAETPPSQSSVLAELARFDRDFQTVTFNSRTVGSFIGAPLRPTETRTWFSRNHDAIHRMRWEVDWILEDGAPRFEMRELKSYRAKTASVWFQRSVIAREDQFEGAESRMPSWVRESGLAELDLPLWSDGGDWRGWGGLESEQLMFARVGWFVGLSVPMTVWFKPTATFRGVRKQPGDGDLWVAESKAPQGTLELEFTWSPFVIRRVRLEMGSESRLWTGMALADRKFGFSIRVPGSPTSALSRAVVTYDVTAWDVVSGVHVPIKFRRTIAGDYIAGGQLNHVEDIEVSDLKAESSVVDDGEFHVDDELSGPRDVYVVDHDAISYVLLDGKIVPKVDSTVLEFYATPPLHQRRSTWIAVAVSLVVVAVAAGLYLRRR